MIPVLAISGIVRANRDGSRSSSDGRADRAESERDRCRGFARRNPGAGSREGDRRIAAGKDEGETFPYCNPLKSPEMGLESRNGRRPARWAPGNSARSRNPQMLSGGSPRPGDSRGASCGKRDPRRERKSRRGFGRPKCKATPRNKRANSLSVIASEAKQSRGRSTTVWLLAPRMLWPLDCFVARAPRNADGNCRSPVHLVFLSAT